MLATQEPESGEKLTVGYGGQCPERETKLHSHKDIRPGTSFWQV